MISSSEKAHKFFCWKLYTVHLLLSTIMTLFAWHWALDFYSGLSSAQSCILIWFCPVKSYRKFFDIFDFFPLSTTDIRATLVRLLTDATAAITLAFLFVEMMCYVLGSLHSSCVLCTKIGLLRWELINKTFLNDDFSNFLKIFYWFMLKVKSSENFSFQSYQNKNL